MPLILGTNSIKETGFNVANSLRFNDGSSDSLTKTPSGAGNRRTWTYSTWLKRTTPNGFQSIMGADAASQGSGFSLFFSFDSTNELIFGQGGDTWLKTNQLFRDPSAFYHIVLAVDTTNGTANNRVRMYINGSEVTSFGTRNNPSQNYEMVWNNTVNHSIGADFPNTGTRNFFDGYMCETVNIDGQQLAPDQFGEFDEDSPTIWKPIDVSGLTFGTNGFYLDFEDSSALGNDAAGSNNYTVNNLTAIDQSTDTCTNNFATLNPLDNYYFNSTFSEGNLKVVTSSGNYAVNTSTFWLSGGKWYWEVKVITSSTNDMIGIANAVSTSTSNYLGANGNGYAYRNAGDVFNTGGSAMSGFGSGTLATYGNGDILMIAMDLDNSKLYFGKNGTWGNSGDPTSGSTGTGAVSIVAVGSTPNGAYTPALSEWHNAASLTAEINFGSPSFSISSSNTDGNGYGNFEYAVPSGYYALNTKNLAEHG